MEEGQGSHRTSALSTALLLHAGLKILKSLAELNGSSANFSPRNARDMNARTVIATSPELHAACIYRIEETRMNQRLARLLSNKPGQCNYSSRCLFCKSLSLSSIVRLLVYTCFFHSVDARCMQLRSVHFCCVHFWFKKLELDPFGLSRGVMQETC